MVVAHAMRLIVKESVLITMAVATLKKTDPDDEHRSDDDAKENDSDCGCILFQEHNTPFLIAMLYSYGSYAADEYLKGSRGAMKVVGDSRSFNKGSVVLPTLIPPFEASDTLNPKP